MNSVRDEHAPDQAMLYPGAVLATIAHCVFIARHPIMQHEQSWDGMNYSVQNSSGSRSTTAFGSKQFVTVCFSNDSPRSPFRSDTKYSLDPFLANLPAELHRLAYQEALQYMLDEYNGKSIPIITSAFWGVGQGPIQSAEAWADVYRHGAFLLKNQLMNSADALDAWQQDMELSAEDTEFVELLFRRKREAAFAPIKLNPQDRDFIRAIGRDDSALALSVSSLEAIGIACE